MYTGQVLWFNDSKGYGFIKTETGHTAFVHYSAIQSRSTDGFKSLFMGQRVELDLYEDATKGYLAHNVMAL
jgi:CspA family cold shock protein